MKAIEYGCKFISKKYPHILEFGVFSGRTLHLIKKNVNLDEHIIFGFDSFEGLPEDWLDINGKIVGGLAEKGWFNLNGTPPPINDVTFYKGWFKDTISEYLKIAKPISLLHIDCDLYSSTIDVLYGLTNFILKDTIIVFDDWIFDYNPNNNNHEQRAFYEWVDDFNIKYEFIESNHIQQKIVKIL